MHHLNLLVLLSLWGVCRAEIPSSIQKCKIEDQDCIVSTINDVLSKGSQGFPEMGIPALDPLKIKTIQIDYQGNQSLSLVFNFKNVDFVGLPGAKFYKVAGLASNKNKMKLEMRFKAAAMSIIGPYSVKSKILAIKMDSSGTANVTLVALDVKVEMLVKVVEREGKKYLNIEAIKNDFEANRLYSDYQGLFTADKIISDSFNLFLDENWKEVLIVLKPSIASSFGKVFMDVINGVFQKIPFNEMFLN